MFRRSIIFVGFALLWLLPFVQSGEASYDYELGSYSSRDSQYRDAGDAEDLIERGRASVTDSPQFPEGIRLTAWANGEEEGFEPGLASAIYYFDVPSWTHFLKVKVRYEDVSRDDKIAGRLWIKTPDEDLGEALESEEEAPVYGDTFVLRSDRASEAIYVPSARHVENDMVEIHIVASGRDSLDVGYIQVEYLERKPPRVRIVEHWYDDYWYRWPPYWYGYHYFYWGPCYWPRTSLIYVHWIWPHKYYWYKYRPWYRIHIVKYHRRHPHWYRRYPRVHHVDSSHPRVKKRIVPHRSLKEPGPHIKNPRARIERGRERIGKGRGRIPKRQKDFLVDRHTPEAKLQKTRRSVRSKPRRIIPSERAVGKIRKESREPPAIEKIRRQSQKRSPTKKVRSEGQKRLQSRSVQRKSGSKSVGRESSRARSRAREVRTQAVTSKRRIVGSGERRLNNSPQMSRR
jgi:hypothetical protein